MPRRKARARTEGSREEGPPSRRRQDPAESPRNATRGPDEVNAPWGKRSEPFPYSRGLQNPNSQGRSPVISSELLDFRAGSFRGSIRGPPLLFPRRGGVGLPPRRPEPDRWAAVLSDGGGTALLEAVPGALHLLLMVPDPGDAALAGVDKTDAAVVFEPFTEHQGMKLHMRIAIIHPLNGKLPERLLF